MVTEQVIIKFRADGTRVVQRQITNVGKASKEASGSVGFLTKALSALGATFILRGAVRTLANFEQQMSTVKAITGATGAEFQRLRDRAKDLGITTRFSATQAAQGLVNLSRAGFSTSEALTTVGDTLLLAQAGSLDLGTAAQITAGLVRGFRVDVDQASRLIDVLSLTANSAATDVTELGEAFKFVAPAAVGLKVPFELASAALGVLADNQLRGAMGGTGLRKVLSTLAKGGAPLASALKRVGLTLDDVDVATVGLIPALEALQEANIGVGEAFKIFGDRGQPAFAVLTANIPKIKEFNEALLGAKGTVREFADIMDDNLNGALLAVKSAFEGVILSFGKIGPTNVLTQLMRSLASVLRVVADNADVLAVAFVGLASFAIPAVIRGINALGVAIAANPIGLAVVSITAAVALLVKFRRQIKLTESGFGDLGDLAAETFSQIRVGVTTVASEFAKATSGILSSLGAIETESSISFQGVVLGVAKAFDIVAGIVSGAFLGIVSVFQELPGALKNTFIRAVNFIVEQINRLLIVIQLQLNTLLENVEVFAARVGKPINLGRISLPRGRIEEILGPGITDIPKIIAQEIERGLLESRSGERLVTAIFAGADERAMERARAIAKALSDAAEAEAAAKAARDAAAGVTDADRGGSAGAAMKEARAIDELVKSLEQERDLLMKVGLEQNVLAANFEAIEALTKDSIDANSEEAKTLLAVVEQSVRENGLLAEKARLLAVLGPTEEQRLVTQQALLEIEKERNLTAAERNKLLVAAGEKMKEATTFAEGLASAFLKIDTSAVGLGKSIGDALVRSVDKASSALAEFVLTGARDVDALKEAVGDLLRDLAKEVIQLIIKLLIVAAIKAALGGGAPAVGPPPTPGLQAGGFVPAGRPTIVGERGPEPFVPTASGRVLPNQTLQPQEPVRVTIVNVTDEEEISAFLNSEEGGDVILNQLARRRKQAQDMLGI